MISSLQIKNFTCFSQNNFQFSGGINVLIGKNSVGKTHLLKLLACVLKANKENNGNGKEKLETILGNKLIGYFKPEYLGRLVKRAQGRNRAEVNIEIEKQTLSFNFATNTKNTVKIEQYEKFNIIQSLYLPPHEIISVFEGFISLYQNREVNFDETYYQLAMALDVLLLKGRRFDEIQSLIKPLEDITESKIIKENGRFYFQNTQGKMEMPLIAEGYRKIATLMYLIANGEIAPNSVLFWDEPEANLNPKLTKQMVDLLINLAKKGVQIFVASHDFLFTHLLSLKSEYRQNFTENELPQISFFGLYEQNHEIIFDTAETLANLSNNAILDEFEAFYDLEQNYLNKLMSN